MLDKPGVQKSGNEFIHELRSNDIVSLLTEDSTLAEYECIELPGGKRMAVLSMKPQFDDGYYDIRVFSKNSLYTLQEVFDKIDSTAIKFHERKIHIPKGVQAIQNRFNSSILAGIVEQHEESGLIEVFLGRDQHLKESNFARLFAPGVRVFGRKDEHQNTHRFVGPIPPENQPFWGGAYVPVCYYADKEGYIHSLVSVEYVFRSSTGPGFFQRFVDVALTQDGISIYDLRYNNSSYRHAFLAYDADVASISAFNCRRPKSALSPDSAIKIVREVFTTERNQIFSAVLGED